MRNSNVSFGAGIAGALLLAVPLLHMVFGADAPRAADAIVGVFGVVLLAFWATSALTRAGAAPRVPSRPRARLLQGGHAAP